MQATNEFRWLEVLDGAGKLLKQVLQQKFSDNDEFEYWVDVPTVTEIDLDI